MLNYKIDKEEMRRLIESLKLGREGGVMDRLADNVSIYNMDINVYCISIFFRNCIT